MATIPSAPLNILTFPQRWNPAAGTLSVHVLVLPKGDLENDFAPAFADATIALNAHLIPSLTQLPVSVTAGPALVIGQNPAARRECFDELLRVLGTTPGFRILPSGAPGPTPVGVRKYLASSYQEATHHAPRRTRMAVTDASYECALVDDPGQAPAAGPKPEFYWPEIIGFVLRQPELAVQLGFLYRTELPLAAPNPFAGGGYMYVDLAAGSDYLAVPRQLFAARIPSLTAADDRIVFAATLFPVDVGGNFDQVIPEAEIYDDGFAKLVHGSQPRRAAQLETSSSQLPAVKDVGIRLAWDDEQVAIWLNRQIGINAVDAFLPPPPSPLGVAGYRVDVFDEVAQRWQSLTEVHADELAVGDVSLGPFDGELSVEVIPANPNHKDAGEFWLPSYFASWAGGSLALADPNPFAIADHMDALGERVYEPVGADRVALRYGNDYRFRVRLMDLTGGGPDALRTPLTPGPASAATVPFRRFTPPKAVKVVSEPERPLERTGRFTIARPDLAYPDVAFTGKYVDPVALLIAQSVAAKAAGEEPALPDPDVTHLRVDVEVRTLAGDPAATSTTGEHFIRLYSTLQAFPADFGEPLELRFAFEDRSTLVSYAGLVVPDGDALPLPSARDVRLVLTAVGSEDAALDYWGMQEARFGAAPVDRYLRVSSLEERDLFAPSLTPEIEAIFMQPDPPPGNNLATQMAVAGLRHSAPSDLVSRLANHLGLPLTNLSLGSPTGRRVVYACSNGLRHLLNPDRSSITFSSKADLTRHWIVAIRLTLDRDWSWDALAAVGFELQRAVGGNPPEVVATIAMPRCVSPVAAQDPDRNQTDLVIFDAFDPKPEVGVPLGEPELSYSLRAVVSDPATGTEEPRQWQMTLPITTPPSQVPKIVSAGFAFSDYTPEDNYSVTKERQRRLFLELDGAPLDARDAYFVRVLAYGPDPMLIAHGTELPSPAEPPLPVDPEPLRSVRLNQTNDRAGLSAMEPLIRSAESPRHYLVPLPKSLVADSPELFGFFVCELRVGHDGTRWCTAQGRFGPPLRATGVQHPAPQLRCGVTRTLAHVLVRAPYASPVLDGTNIRPRIPRTTLFGLLYAQVLQVDGAGWRNVLLLRARGRIDEGEPNAPEMRLVHGVMTFDQNDILNALRVMGLAADAPLSALAVETMPEPDSPYQDPVGVDLGQVRFLRTSTLTPVPEICPPHEAV